LTYIIAIGDTETAKKYLIASKGLEQTIASAESDLPLDMNQVLDFFSIINDRNKNCKD